MTRKPKQIPPARDSFIEQVSVDFEQEAEHITTFMERIGRDLDEEQYRRFAWAVITRIESSADINQER